MFMFIYGAFTCFVICYFVFYFKYFDIIREHYQNKKNERDREGKYVIHYCLDLEEFRIDLYYSKCGTFTKDENQVHYFDNSLEANDAIKLLKHNIAKNCFVLQITNHFVC